MGQLVSLFQQKPPSDIQVDFEQSEPPADDAKAVAIHAEAGAVLGETAAILASLQGYKGCDDLIRLAMSAPRDAVKQRDTFEGMLPNVRLIKSFYDLAQRIEGLTSRLIQHLAASADLGAQHALLRQLADLLNFALRFDQYKMMCPKLQNDFSFYRRSLGKFASHPNLPVNDVAANSISMFIAQATPMMSTLGMALGALHSKTPKVTELLATVANVCCAMVMRNKAAPPSISQLALSAMTVAIVLYDHAHPGGVFRRGTPVNLKKCVSQLKGLPAAERDPLLNTLQYSTRTYKNAPEAIKNAISRRG